MTNQITPPTPYGPNTICMAGSATATAASPIAIQYDKLILVLILDRETGVILDAECNMILDVTSDFIASLLIGHCFLTELDDLIAQVQARYMGSNQRALIVCMKDIYSKALDRCPDLPFVRSALTSRHAVLK